jgi:hypothetical protein
VTEIGADLMERGRALWDELCAETAKVGECARSKPLSAVGAAMNK